MSFYLKKKIQTAYIYYLLFNMCKFLNCFDSLRDMTMPAKTTLKETQKKNPKIDELS